ncbi:type I secretion system permease/ATPase [Notoacmeibacter marinus]|uniref:type I secretion system permease/ATPase n=1 Tax=Notoacmeibacter marinus TaxID=1876515 RepID=UPI0013B050CB|nr:type I secretion system permease/ATPase [Notoacmeibacter marinus]
MQPTTQTKPASSFRTDGVALDRAVHVSPGTNADLSLRSILAHCRSAFLGVALFSCIINLLMLTGPLFMMQIYDRVLTSGSIPTLIALLLLVTGLYIFYALFEVLRSRILIKAGEYLDQRLSPTVFQTILAQPLEGRSQERSSSLVRDMDTVRKFLSGTGPLAFFDMPWTPIFLAVIFVFHPVLGLIAAGGAAILLAIAIVSEFINRGLVDEASVLQARRSHMAGSSQKNAETARAMGMTGELERRWSEIASTYLQLNGRASNRTGVLSSVTKALRLFMQSAMLAAGAWLAILQEVSPGTIIAASIILSRALAPIELAVGNWRGFLAARQSSQRLKSLLKRPEHRATTALPAPCKTLRLSGVAVSPPASSAPTILGVDFTLNAGDALGILGPSGSGKSTLVRAMAGIWPTIRGDIRLDGAMLEHWDPDRLGPHIGYLPQSLDLFAGSIAQNIARLDPAASDGDIIEAAKLAGVHDLIVSLAEGYDTEIGEGGHILSVGQRQRIGLARALYGKPFLILLDEPNSNLDQAGEKALTKAIETMRSHGSIVVVVAHRPSAVEAVSHILMIDRGRQLVFDTKDRLNRTRETAAGLVTPVTAAAE